MENLKTELADAYAEQMKLELQLKHKDGVITHLKRNIEHQRGIIRGLQEKILELMTQIGKPLDKELEHE